MSAIASQLLGYPLSAAAPKEGPRVASVTVVCCVESGPLETTTLLMIESLRRWGGRFSQVPVIAVTPRFGPALKRETLKRFEELHVRYIRRNAARKYSWYSFLNKPLALNVAEPHVATDTMVWLDADVFVTGAPEAFELDSHTDFAGCPSDCNLGSTGAGDRYESYWNRMCKIHGIAADTLPWVNTCREGTRIRLYFNGGVLAYRKASGYGPAYLEGCIRALDARVRSRDAGLFFAEQVTAGIIAVKQNLRIGQLPESCNYAVGSKCEGFDPAAFSRATILHYHDSLWDHFFPQFVEMCRIGKPELYTWLKPLGSLTNTSPPISRTLGKVLKTLRTRRSNAFEAQCEVC
jgi:hypothetical protein